MEGHLSARIEKEDNSRDVVDDLPEPLDVIQGCLSHRGSALSHDDTLAKFSLNNRLLRIRSNLTSLEYIV